MTIAEKKPNVRLVYLAYLHMLVGGTNAKDYGVRVYDAKQGMHVTVNVPRSVLAAKAAAKLASQAKYLGFVTTHNVGENPTLMESFYHIIDMLNKSQETYKFVIKWKSPDFCNANYYTGNYLNFFIVEVQNV